MRVAHGQQRGAVLVLAAAAAATTTAAATGRVGRGRVFGRGRVVLGGTQEERCRLGHVEKHRGQRQLRGHRRLVDCERVEQVHRSQRRRWAGAVEGPPQDVQARLDGVGAAQQQRGPRLPAAERSEQREGGAGDGVGVGVPPQAGRDGAHHARIDQLARRAGLRGEGHGGAAEPGVDVRAQLHARTGEQRAVMGLLLDHADNLGGLTILG